MVQVRSKLAAGVAAFAVTALVTVGGVRAQDGTPVGGAEAPMPNHIHSGTCETLGDVVVPLAPLQFSTDDAAAATPAASPVSGVATPVGAMMGTMGAASSVPVAAATTQVPLGLSDILAAEHAINIHDPADPSDPSLYRACGAIGGSPDAQGNLFVGLQEINDSGFSGIAWLLDDGSGAGTTVTILLADNGKTTGEMGGTAATPTT